MECFSNGSFTEEAFLANQSLLQNCTYFMPHIISSPATSNCCTALAISLAITEYKVNGLVENKGVQFSFYFYKIYLDSSSEREETSLSQ